MFPTISCTCIGRFARNAELLAAKDSRRVIALYNRVARALVEYEIVWQASWLRTIETATAALDNTLIFQDPRTGEETHLTCALAGKSSFPSVIRVHKQGLASPDFQYPVFSGSRTLDCR